MDDTTPGQVYFYQGTKQAAGNPVEQAGLSGGNLWGLKVPGVAFESRAGGLDGTPQTGEAITVSFFNKNNVTSLTGAQLQADSVANGITEFLRPEDGAWNPVNPNQFIFVTTDRFDQVKAGTGAQEGRSRLWQLDIADLSDLSLGGELTMLLDGTEAQQMMDNLTITDAGLVLLQEDPGGQDYLSKSWAYDLAGGSLTEYGQHDASFFAPGAPGFLTRDEESSGIIDITSIIGGNPSLPVYLLDVQAHYSLGGELVEGGQLVVLQAVPEASTSTAGVILALGAGLAFRRHRNRRA